MSAWRVNRVSARITKGAVVQKNTPSLQSAKACAACAGPQKGPKLRFCPDSNDILYPREDRQRKVLVYFCKSCDHEVRLCG